jgi:NAD(P)-dependent dehydrogenase (short-subunit alcohol dehydrogenase family)
VDWNPHDKVERGRKPVVLYGAAKAGLSRYLEGLDHRYHAKGLRVVCVKPGFVRTGMTAGLPEPPFAGDPAGIWRWMMLVIRLLPRAVTRKVGFWELPEAWPGGAQPRERGRRVRQPQPLPRLSHQGIAKFTLLISVAAGFATEVTRTRP